MYSNGKPFKRFGSKSGLHNIDGPHVHQPFRNVAPNGNVYTGVTAHAYRPTTRDVKQLYQYLFNGKYY